MTAAELAAFIADVRAQASAAVARLDTVDPDALPADLRAAYERERQGWRDLLARTTDDAIELHVAVCEQAGRDLTPDELRGLLGVQ